MRPEGLPKRFGEPLPKAWLGKPAGSFFMPHLYNFFVRHVDSIQFLRKTPIRTEFATLGARCDPKGFLSRDPLLGPAALCAAGHFFLRFLCAIIFRRRVCRRESGLHAFKKARTGHCHVLEVAYLAPPAELSAYVSAYYLATTDEAQFEDLERADIAQYRFLLEGDVTVTFGTGETDRFHPVTIMGPRTKASRVSAKGPVRVFGVGLLPAGWAAFTQVPADRHVNGLINAVDLFGERVLETAKLLKGMTALKDMGQVMTENARKFSENASTVPHWFIRAVDQWLEGRLSPDIADLETATNLSRRQIERLCRHIYGSPPKLLVRKYRALRTANAIARGDGDWQDFIDEGFYDQAHCIREIKEFVGITPSAVRQHASRLTSKTFDRSQLLGRIATLSAQT